MTGNLFDFLGHFCIFIQISAFYALGATAPSFLRKCRKVHAQVLSLAVELFTADRAGYRNLALAFRNSQRVMAFRTGEISVCLAVAETIPHKAEFLFNRFYQLFI